MRVLMLTQYYAPEPHDKFTGLARGLADRGVEVQVLTGFPCYPLGRTYDGWRQRVWATELDRGVEVVRLPQLPDHSRSAVRRALYYLSFALSAATIGLWRSRPADVVLVYQAALPVGIAGWWLSLWRRAPLVLDVVDLWPESVAASGIARGRWLMRAIGAVADFVYARARRVCVITEGYRRNLLARGVPADKLSVLHMWGERDGAGPTAPPPGLPDVARRPFVAMYTGATGPCQGLEAVLDAAALLGDDPRIGFVLVGDGVSLVELQARAAALGLTNLAFVGRRPRGELRSWVERADALLLCLKSDPMSDVSIPSKTIDYLAAGKPVVAAIEGETARLIEENGCGLVSAPGDPAALAASIRAYANDPAAAAAAGLRAKAVAARLFDRHRQIDRFDAMLRAVVERRGPTRTITARRAA